MRRIIPILFLILILILTSFINRGNAASLMPEEQKTESLQEIRFSLSGLDLRLSTPFLSNQQIILPEADDPVQVATILHQKPQFQEISITAIPEGSSIGTEIFPRFENSKLNFYKELLINFRKEQGGEPVPGPVVNMFGDEVMGISSIINLNVNTTEKSPVQIIEWVTEYEDRLWILRASQELVDKSLPPQTSQLVIFEKNLEGLVLSAFKKNSNVYEYLNKQHPETDLGITPFGVSTDLPAPSWWGGFICDLVTYYDQTGEIAYPLGASYRGVLACGPRPWADGGDHAVVRFFPGAWGELEWECVELSMRFMYLAYGIAPYQANGNQVVTNYSGDRLIKIYNGTPGISPQPNDILSTGVTSTYGHTVVVMENHVDNQGNGTIKVLEQNSSVSGVRDYMVINWFVQSTDTVIGWLHDPSSSDILLTYFPISFR